jgi:predicted HAD superfamily Cof-like phosphohydrolase
MPRNRYHDTPVVELHEAFGLPIAWNPAVPSFARRKLRVALILEELLEFAEASGVELSCCPEVCADEHPDGADPIAAADALADLRYVVDGSNLEWGIPGEKCLREVHRSNMSKLGEDGRPLLRDDGKFLKGPNYTPPDLASILELYKGIDNG